MARPKKAEKEQRNAWLGVRLSAAERGQIENEAAKLELTASDYVRRCAIRGTVRVIHDKRKADPQLVLNLLAIGNNLNQIARKLNMTDRVPANLNDTLAVLRDLLTQLGKGDGS